MQTKSLYEALAAMMPLPPSRMISWPGCSMIAISACFGKVTARTVSEGTASWSSTTCARPQAARSSTRGAFGV
jgi:hypothetical protein